VDKDFKKKEIKKTGYKVAKGQKIRGVKIVDKVVILQAGDLIPDDYKIPEDYIKNNIVEAI